MSRKILVLGASGNVGKPLVSTLVGMGEAVKAASRSGLSHGGAEGVAFDFTDPSTFGPAFEDVDRAFVMLPAGYVSSRELLVPVIEAAAQRRVKVVLQTALGVDADDSIPYRQVELVLIGSGIPFVILRPNWFADNFHNAWKAGVDHGEIRVPAGTGKSSFIDTRDIAGSAAAVLSTGRFDGHAYNLTGPSAMSYAEAAAVISSVTGEPVSYRDIDDETFVQYLTAAGVAADYAHFLTAIFHPVREGWTAVVTRDVETLTGRKPRSFETYARDHFVMRAHQ